ncbi:MAG TPA: FAD-dependent oxidoreductase [Gemmatimonadaceae bacterium]|jgi:glycine/D-amino acid oxidase-like deaminating enzyme
MPESAEVVIVGAGIAGIAAAYHLAVRHGVRRVVLIDEREPLTLTSDKGTQAYRNWWPGPDSTMLQYMTRSIDILEEIAEESANAYRLNRRGYVFVTAEDEGADRLRATARLVSAFGMGELREHIGKAADYQPAPAEGYTTQPTGADLLPRDAARRAFPGLAPNVKTALHVRRAGWMNAIALGDWMLKRAAVAGVTFVRDRVTSFATEGGRVRGVRLASGATLATNRVAIAAGPGLPDLLRLLDLELPLFHELHAKLTFRDTRGVVARSLPFLIWNDPVVLPWTAAERITIMRTENALRLLSPFPGGVHIRPIDGPHGDEVYFIWTYDIEPRSYTWPPRFDPTYGEATLRGSARMMPGMSAYFGMAAQGLVDGGFYCKSRENRPLVGPLAVEGMYVLGALSGFGIMASHAGADLLAAHLTGAKLPDYAKWFLPSRYDDASYCAQIEQWGAQVGQL